MEPPVSDPIAMRTIPAATAAPEPEEEPPVMWSKPHGIARRRERQIEGRAADGELVRGELADQDTPPAAASLAATTQSAAGTWSTRSFEWQVVRMPAVS